MLYPCPNCGRKYRSDHLEPGHEVSCPNCQTCFVITALPAWSFEDGGSPPEQVVTRGSAAPSAPAEASPEPGPAPTNRPENCPECGRVLYPVVRLRPVPRLQPRARLLLAAGLVVSGALYLFGLMAVRSVIPLPMWLLSLVWFPVALLPALGCGYLAWDLPRVTHHRCRGCGWQARVLSGDHGHEQ
jgi:hypothetical protein